MSAPGGRRRRPVLGVVLATLCAVLPAAAAEAGEVRGFVDGRPFLETLGENGVTVEISLSGALLKALTGVDAELEQMAGGLESIHALVLSPKSEREVQALRDLIRSTEGTLAKKGWQAVATVREPESTVKLMVLSDEEAIQGLVVMIVEADGPEPEVVFVNIAGKLDLAALSKIREWDVPGLDALEGMEVEP